MIYRYNWSWLDTNSSYCDLESTVLEVRTLSPPPSNSVTPKFSSRIKSQQKQKKLEAEDFVSLTFIAQNNRVGGEEIRHKRSSHTRACAVMALGCCVLELTRHGSNGKTPLFLHWEGYHLRLVCYDKIAASLCSKVTDIRDQVNFQTADVSARSMMAGGTMARILSRIGSDTIILVVRCTTANTFA